MGAINNHHNKTFLLSIFVAISIYTEEMLGSPHLPQQLEKRLFLEDQFASVHEPQIGELFYIYFHIIFIRMNAFLKVLTTCYWKCKFPSNSYEGFKTALLSPM